MNKAEIDRYLPQAYLALQEFGIAKSGKVSGTFRGYISSFGASITMGSLRAAIAFHSQQNNALLPRDSLMKALYYLITEPASVAEVESTSLLRYVFDHPEKEAEITEHIYNASIALKLAMNMYVIAED